MKTILFSLGIKPHPGASLVNGDGMVNHLLPLEMVFYFYFVSLGLHLRKSDLLCIRYACVK